MTDSDTFEDPHAEREAENYTNPIASRELLLQLLSQARGPLTREQIAEQLAYETEEQFEALRRRLRAMERDGQIIGNRVGAYGLINKMNLVRGRVMGHRDGYGFVLPCDGGDDIYLPPRQMKRVFDGDEVFVRLASSQQRGKREGTIVEVLSYNTKELVGRYSNERGTGFVRADNPRVVQDVLVVEGEAHGAQAGQFVVVEIIEQPGRSGRPKGRISQVLGDHLAPGMEIDVAIRSHGIPHLWPADVADQAARLPAEVNEPDKEKRVDLRHLPLVTIDGEDARDFDDAVYCERKSSGGWRLFVAIADVSHYVAINSSLDREALNRSTSVYFPDFVVPMLPEALSNGLCSLNPNVDRLCIVCEMTVSERGRVSGYQFYEAVMHSHARLTYTQVGQILADRGKKRSGVRQQYHRVVPHLDNLHDLYVQLRAMRDERGAIDFETQETRILFDNQRKINRIVPVERNDAHKLIEECMLAANVSAARFLEAHKIPGLYRVHEGPRPQKLELLKEFLRELSLGLPSGRENVSPQQFQVLIEQIQGRADAHIIQTVMLRSMNQAVYQPDNKGHFGLAYTAYAHFTSPIRRYPDLLVHRAIRRVIRSTTATTKVRRVNGAKRIAKAEIYPYEFDEMLTLGEHCSMAERRADEATRDVVSWLKCEYLSDRVGEVFQGVVSSVVAFGLFVELKDLYVEGLVHVTSLPQDYYRFDPAHHRMVGERSRRAFRLGDELTVQVVRVDLDERKVDFELAATQKRVRKRRVSAKAKELAAIYDEEQSKKQSKKKKIKQSKKSGKKAVSTKAKKSKNAKVKKVKSAKKTERKNGDSKTTKNSKKVSGVKKTSKAKKKAKR